MAVLLGDADRSNISFSKHPKKQTYGRKLQHRDSPQNYKRSCKAARTCPVFGIEIKYGAIEISSFSGLAAFLRELVPQLQAFEAQDIALILLCHQAHILIRQAA